MVMWMMIRLLSVSVTATDPVNFRRRRPRAGDF